MGIVIMAAIVVSLVSWIYLGLMLYRDHLEERERVTEEWRRRNAKPTAEDWRAIGKDMKKSIEDVSKGIELLVGKVDE